MLYLKKKTNFDDTWRYFFPLGRDELNIYAQQGKIPLGTKYHQSEYRGNIKEEDIVFARFELANKFPFNTRDPFNMFILGGTGDGKSKMIKLMWSIFHSAGYYSVYIDPKSTDSGNAKIGAKHGNLPPHLYPKGIPIRHYIPTFASEDFEHLMHHFRVYSNRIYNLNREEMWMSLGVSQRGASRMAQVIKEYGKKTTFSILSREIEQMRFDKTIMSQTVESIRGILDNLIKMGFLDTKYPELDMWKDFQEGYSVCISYNSAGMNYMSYDIGDKIHTLARGYFKGNTTPIIIFFDDSSFYAKEKKELVKLNYAVQGIGNIGYNYRSLGLNNIMAVQNIDIIEDRVANSYNRFIITPRYNHPENLRKINIPPEAIEIIRERRLIMNKDLNIQQNLYIDEDGRVFPFYPFMPPCNHFVPVYKPRLYGQKGEVISEGKEEVEDGSNS